MKNYNKKNVYEDLLNIDNYIYIFHYNFSTFYSFDIQIYFCLAYYLPNELPFI